MKRMSLIAQFKIDFLLPFIGCRKVLRKMSALGVSRHVYICIYVYIYVYVYVYVHIYIYIYIYI